ncbi:MAG: hypothetical protein MUQ27_11830 [Acidimicrobiia bacterium]|nr:hypothetical protein [Acidimicrobiia bacterium]
MTSRTGLLDRFDPSCDRPRVVADAFQVFDVAEALVVAGAKVRAVEDVDVIRYWRGQVSR